MTDEVFEELVWRLDHQSPLMGAFRAAEQWFEVNQPDGHLNTDVVRRAWDQLDLAQQHDAMEVLFNGFWHMVMASRRWQELDAKEPDGNTYLVHGDLEVLDYAADMIEDGMVPIDVDQLRRIISEVELLQHRLKMRGSRAEG